MDTGSGNQDKNSENDFCSTAHITLLVPKAFYIFIILVHHINCLNRTHTQKKKH